MNSVELSVRTLCNGKGSPVSVGAQEREPSWSPRGAAAAPSWRCKTSAPSSPSPLRKARRECGFFFFFKLQEFPISKC